jgi:hypothetical protein
MKKFTKELSKDMSTKAPNYMAILAILSEMARHVNENISKVYLKPLEQALKVRSPDSIASNS